MERVKVGVIGCGNISGIYLSAGARHESIEIIACADLDMDRARAKAKEHGTPRACTSEELLADPEIEIVANLTVPLAHYPVAKAALEAGKSTYAEKPIAVSREQGRELLALAAERNLLVGCAPDTFLGGGIQTCRKLIDDGAIGRPIGGSAFMMCHGHESWHPDPEFYYKLGGGPVFDMGPYYLTALVNLLGPVRRVASSAHITFPGRTITSQPKNGTRMTVEVPTHVVGLLEFVGGAVCSLGMSFDTWAHRLPCIEIYGTEGTLAVPDPNGFGGPVLLWHVARPEWREVALTHGYAAQNRGIGVADMAYALRSGRPHRASGELAFHVLDVMCALHEGSGTGAWAEIVAQCQRPAPLPTGLPPGKLDP
jgi:predicted dehydrogenase